MKKFVKIIAVLMAVLVLMSACSKKEEVISGGTYMFVTGKSGGAYNSLGLSMAGVWDKYLGTSTNVISTTGSVQNIEMLIKGDADFGFVQSDILYYAQNGKEMYEENKQRGLSVLATLYSEAVQVIVNAGTDIQTVSDLLGKTVAVGKYGTATEAAARQILEAYGITYDLITVKYQTFSEASEGLANGSIDAIFAVSALPSSNISIYAETHSIRFLPVSTSGSGSKLRRSCPFFTDGVIKSEVYGTENSVSTVCIDVLLICRSNLSSDAVYGVVSSLFNNLNELSAAHSKGAEINADTAKATKVGSLHTGAKKYYNEVAAAVSE